MSFFFLMFLGLSACTGDNTIPFDETPPGKDSGGEDSEPVEGKDSGDSEPAPFTEPQVSGITWRVHEEFGTLIVVEWFQFEPATVWVEYNFDGEWVSTPVRTVESGEQSQILLGIPYNSDLSFRIVNDFGQGPLLTEETPAATGEQPDDIPLAEVLVSDEAHWDPAINYVMLSMSEGGNFSDTWWVFIVDRKGRVVWARETDSDRIAMYPRVSYDKTSFLIDDNSFWAIWDNGMSSQISRMKIDGTVEQVYDTPGLHHSFTELADGSIVWGYMHSGDETLEKLDPAGVQSTIWSCQEFIAEINDRVSYCGSNTVYWNEATDTFLFSFYSFDTIVQIDHATGETLRWFGDVNDSWTFDPADSEFWWQHGAFFTDEGTLITSTHKAEGGGGATIVREYSLDDSSRTLTEIWNFGIEEPVYGDQMGEAHRLPSGNILHNYGTTPRIREGTYEGDVVWDISWGSDYSRYLGRSTPIEDLYVFLP